MENQNAQSQRLWLSQLCSLSLAHFRGLLANFPLRAGEPEKNMIVKKVGTWIKRYLPAETVCTICAMCSASVAYLFTDNKMIIALAGTWGENIGFYGVIVGRDIYSSRKHHKASGDNYTIISLFKNIRGIILEFGLAEILDSFLIRPFMMYVFPKLTGSMYVGIFTGKIAADIFAYIPIVISYELQQKYKDKR